MVGQDKDSFDAICEAMNGSSKVLPGEIIMAILLALTVKPLLRFKSVCRSWHALILSLPFINMHHDRAKRNSLICFYKQHVYNSISVCEDETITDLLLPPPTLPKRFRQIVVAAACRGMVCFSSASCSNSAVVWNNATREYRIFNGIGRGDIDGRSYYSLATGFTFLPLINDYKLVRVIIYANHTAYIKITRWNGDNSSIPAKEMETDFPYNIVQHGHCLNANDAIHWLGHDKVGPVLSIVIAFDMVEEKFRQIETPFYQEKPIRHYHRKLALFKESTLAIFGSSVSSTGYLSFHIWALKNYRHVSESWAKQFTFEAASLLCYDLQPMGFWLNDEVVFYRMDETPAKMGLYDIHTNQIKDFPVDIDFDYLLYYSSIIQYKDSLVPLPHMKKNKMTNNVCCNHCPFQNDQFNIN
ncbi:PREDICTED: putative F-box/LRR-repeat/kelch-repeat protein At1g11620 [Nicotiana attenuata]|nr:PREDICTED: putative F-box/LRR-repeat/kelch-repeat protein At1g11620 [Nicotiana attenuata]